MTTLEHRDAVATIEKAPPTVRWIASLLTNPQHTPVQYLREPIEIAPMVGRTLQAAPPTPHDNPLDRKRQHITAQMMFSTLIPVTLHYVSDLGMALDVISACHICIRNFDQSESDPYFPATRSETAVYYMRKAFLNAVQGLRVARASDVVHHELWGALNELFRNVCQVTL